MAKQEKYIMALFKITGHYLTYVEGYVEAETAGEASRKSIHGRRWKTPPTEIPIHELSVDYVKEVDAISPSRMLQTQPFRKGSNEQ